MRIVRLLADTEFTIGYRRCTMPIPYDDDFARLARAVSHPVRVRLLRRLVRQGPAPVGVLVREIGLAQSTVSQHLAALRQAGLVQHRVVDRTHVQAADPKAIRHLSTLVAGLAASLPRDGTGPA